MTPSNSAGHTTGPAIVTSGLTRHFTVKKNTVGAVLIPYLLYWMPGIGDAAVRPG